MNEYLEFVRYVSNTYNQSENDVRKILDIEIDAMIEDASRYRRKSDRVKMAGISKGLANCRGWLVSPAFHRTVEPADLVNYRVSAIYFSMLGAPGRLLENMD